MRLGNYVIQIYDLELLEDELKKLESRTLEGQLSITLMDTVQEIMSNGRCTDKLLSVFTQAYVIYKKYHIGIPNTRKHL